MAGESPAAVLVLSDGTEIGNATDPVRTDPTGTTTQPVSAASLPLPTGAATEATLASLAAEDFATETKLEAVRVILASIDGKDFATETKLEAVRALLASLDGKDFATETTLSAINTKLPTQGQAAMVASQPVAIASDQSTLPVSAASLPLPSGAATETTLAALAAEDFATEVTLAAVLAQLDVDLSTRGSEATLSTLATETKLEAVRALLASLDGKDFSTETTLAAMSAKLPALGQAAMAASQPVAISSDQSTVPVSTASLPLPAGAATETTLAALAAEDFATQTTLAAVLAQLDVDLSTRATEATLSAIDTKLPAQGQATMAASQPVAIASNQSDVPVSATSLPLPTGAATEATLATLATETKLEAVRVLLASLDGKDFATQATLAAILAQLDVDLSTRASEVTLSAIDTKLPSQGQALMTASQPVVIASNQSDVPISATSLPLPTGAATESSLAGLATETKLEAVRVLLASIDTNLPAQGQALSAASQPVVMASDQTPIPITGSVTVGTVLPGDVANLVSTKLLDGASPSMRVDGSVTPVEFTYDADPTDDVLIREMRVVFSAAEFKLDGNKFATKPALTNGLLFEVTSGGTTAELANVTVNEEFFLFPSPGVLLEQGGANEIIMVSFPLGVTLDGGSGDNIKVTVRDDLDDGAYMFLQATVVGEVQP